VDKRAEHQLQDSALSERIWDDLETTLRERQVTGAKPKQDREFTEEGGVLGVRLHSKPALARLRDMSEWRENQNFKL
jgi:hypothetical protein